MNQSDASENTKPYCAWGTFETCLDHLNGVGIPNVVDRNAMPPTLSGASKYEVLGALKSLSLIDKDGRPNTTLLPRLVSPDSRKETMVGILETNYSGLFSLPLSTAGPTEINKWFSDNAGGSTAQRAKAFFIRAAKANGIAMHSLVAQGARSSSGGIKRRKNGRRMAKVPESAPPPRVDDLDKPATSGSPDGILDKLLDKFPDFDPSWSAEVQSKWFEGFGRLQDQLKK